MVRFISKAFPPLAVLSAISFPIHAYACDITGGLISWQGDRRTKIALVRGSLNQPAPRVIDSDTKTLPKNYSGIDPYLVWTILSRSQERKDEYETTQQAEKRADLKIPYVIKYGYNTSHSLPFVKSYKPSSLRGLLGAGLAYDADSQKLDFTLSSRSNDFRVVISQDSRESEYVGTNAFGVTTKVTRITSCQSAIEFKKPQSLMDFSERALAHLQKYLKEEIKVSIPATPEQARNIKSQSLSVVFLLTPSTVPPIVDTDSYSTKPTIDDPYDIFTVTHLVRGTLNGILIVNQLSGQVLGSRFFDN